jgi:cobalt/nickel transport protein
MRPKDRNLIIVAVVACLIIGVMAPFIASNNPDGLEKTAQQISSKEESGVINSPFTDYQITLLGDNPFSGIIAMIIGILIVLGLGYVIALILKKRKTKENSE